MTTLCFTLTVAACQVQAPGDPTTSTEQAVSSAYCGAVMPATPFWNGTVPKLASDQIFLVYKDPDKPGEWVGVVAQPDAQKILWGARVKTSGLGPFVDAMSNAGQIDVGRIVPTPPPVGPIGQGEFVLEWAQRAIPMQADIENAASQCP